MNDKYVSVIIPVYNCEEYLEKCIESVLNQSYKALEVLLINDGSKDRSGNICDIYKEKDKRIKVFHISNGGVSNARNIGLQNAQGDYIQFVDSDDSIKKNMTETLVRALEDSNANLVVCSYDRVTKYIKRKDKMWDRPGIYSNKEYLINTLQDPTGYYYGVIWNKLYKRELIIKNKIHFNKSLNLGEDFVFNLEYLTYAEKVSVISDRLYIYNYTSMGTLSRGGINTFEMYKKELDSRINIFENYKKSFMVLDIYEKNEKKIYSYWKNFYFNNMYELIHGFPDFSEADKREWNELLITNQYVSRCIANISNLERMQFFLRIKYNRLTGKMKKPIKHMITVLKR